MNEFWAFVGITSLASGTIYIALSVYLAVFKNPDMDRFLYNDERFVQAVAAGGIPFGVMRAFEYGIYFIICRLFDKPINKFFKNAKSPKPSRASVVYELNILFILISAACMVLFCIFV